MSAPVCVEPGAGADDLVVADLLELRLYFDAALTTFLDLEMQDLTGLVWAASGWRLFPPEVAVRDAAPFGVVGKERGERLGVALVECFGGRAQLIDQSVSMAARYARFVDGRLTVEILFFAGSPNYERARELVEQVAAGAGIETEMRLTEVRSELDAERAMCVSPSDPKSLPWARGPSSIVPGQALRGRQCSFA